MLCTVAVTATNTRGAHSLPKVTACGKLSLHVRHRYGALSEGRSIEGYYHLFVAFPPDTPDEWLPEPFECLDCGARWEAGILQEYPGEDNPGCAHDGTVVRLSMCCGSQMDEDIGFCPSCREHA